MKIKRHFSALLATGALALTLTTPTQAALINRGGGMIYDTTQNITWLADMNYVKTSGYDSDGLLTWAQAGTWADNLVYGGFRGWRLPTLNAFDTSCSDNISPGGGFPQQYFGYNCTGGELSHLFVTDLGNKAGQSVLNPTGDTAEQIANLALFSNVQSYAYWSGTAYAPNPVVPLYFYTDIGYQSFNDQVDQLYALAVRDGDVPDSTVPEPGTALLVVAALAGLGVRRRRRAVRASAL